MQRKIIVPLPANPTLAEFISHHISRSHLSQREIAKLCGFVRPNVVSMIRTGDTRLPLDRLGAMARAIDIDPFELYCRFMEEYYSETWRELRPLISRAAPPSP